MMNTAYFNEFNCHQYDIRTFFILILICFSFSFFAKKINTYHAGYCMHFIPAEFDQINNLQHFT